MLKIFKQRFILGIISGVFIGFIIAIIISFSCHLSYFQPSDEKFIHYWGNNLNATAVSAIIWALIGLVFSFASLIFEVENWGITKQTIVHFIITYMFFTPLAILAGWFPLPLKLHFLISFTILFIIIYIFTWCYSFKKAKENLKLINSRIKANKKRI